MTTVYTATDLTAETVAREGIRLGVIGNPIAHSKSPQMQQAALAACGVSATYVRVLAGTAAGDFEAMLQQLATLGFIGCNVTVPFKKQAFAAAVQADALATLCGAANTLVRQEDGWHCHNTDGPGFERAISELSGKKLCELRIVILGACGGAGSALAAQCALSNCPQLTLINRPRPQLDELARKLAPHTTGTLRTAHFNSPDADEAIRTAELIVNATSLGLAKEDALPMDPALLHEGQIVYDIVTHDTPLRRAAAMRGCITDNGLGMLLWQGALAFEHWFGTLPPIAPMRTALG
ncbi:MAG: shikimate dehydrogenase [Akkermansiaceae bacterium]|nr:shikimate dehydrogenase [Akkermansiaceae bacterium]